MKLTTEALSARRFIYETEAARGPITIELDPSSGVTGCWSSDEDGHLVDAGTDEALVVDHLEVPLADGALSVRGPVRGESVHVDLSTHEGPVEATITVARLGGAVDATWPSSERPLELERLDGDGVSVRLGKVHRVDAEAVTIGSVTFERGGVATRLEGVRAEVVALRVGPRGRWRLRVGRLAVREIVTGRAGDRIRLDDALFLHLVIDSERGLRAGRATVRRARWRHTTDATPRRATDAAPAARAPFPWRALLQRLDGTLSADVHTEVKIAMMPTWNVLHPLRLTFERGRVRYDALERSMHSLPDAVLDFEVGERRLELIKDIPFVPFDRATLLSWPLPPAEELDARDGWVALTRLLDPDVHVRRRPQGRDQGSQRLEAIRADAIHLDVGRPGEGAIDLGPFGRVTFDGDGEGLGSLVVTGRVVYRPDTKREPGHLALQIRDLGWGLAPLQLGRHRVQVGAARVARAGARLDLDGITPNDVVAEVHGIEAEELEVGDGPSNAAAEQVDAAQ